MRASDPPTHRSPDATRRERELADFFENAPVALHWLGADGTILRANQAELDLLGYARDEYVGRPIADFHADPDVVEGYLARLSAGETLHEVPARLRCKDGSFRDVLIGANALFEDGRFVHARSATRDVTESVRAESRLQTQDAVTRILAEAQTLAEAAPGILEVVGEHLGWDVGGLWSVDDEHGALRCVHVWHRPSVRVPQFEAASRARRFTRGVGLPGRVWADAKAAWIPDVVVDSNFPRAPIAHREGLHGAFAFPIVLNGEVRGVIEFFSPEVRRPDEELLRMMTAIGSQMGQFLERERAREASRASEIRFSRFMQHLPGLAWIKDSDGRYVYANDAAVKAFRTPREELYGRTDGEVFPVEIAAQFRGNDRQALESGSGVQEIETLEHDDGIVHHSLVSKFPILDVDGAAVLVGGMAIDITDRLHAERELQRSQERLDLAQRAGGVGTFEWILGSNEVTWTEAEEQLYGLPRGGFGGRYENWKQAVHPDDRERAEDDVLRAVRERVELDTEFRVVWPDGTVRWIAAKGRVFCDDVGEPVRVLGVNMDVTARKQAEEALREADRRKDEFLATLAHELRNPLSPIRNGLQILRHAGPGDPTAERVREMLERQVEHMVRLVDDLLEVSRITRGKIELRLEPVEVAAVVSAAVETSRPLLEARGHQLALHVPAEPLYLDADPVRLSQVLANLLNNAAKYTDPGGHITVTAVRRGGEIEISVRDDGIGIAAEMLSRIFDMFTQSDRSLSRAQGGLGIGLTLVKNLVQMHGGRVHARSDGPRRGSEFSVVLPVARSAPAGLREPAGPGEGRAERSHRILIVDDNRDVAESLQILLQRFGSEARVAHDGASALAALGSYEASVVLLDIGMPGMDGYEVARRIRARPRQPDLLVALTGWGQEEDRRLALEAGFDHHLRKPVDLDALRELLAGIA